MTEPEVMLWAHLRRRAPGEPAFRRQHPIGPYILDFFCARASLAIEVDGAQHGNDAQAAHDARRDGWLRAQGITVRRTPASAIFEDARQVADGVRRLAAELVGGRRAPEENPAPSTTRSSAGGPPPPSSSRQGRKG